MRILHTSDWHLGRIFHGIHLTEDQAYLLTQMIQLIKETKPDAILIAGDIFDRSVPPTEAVNLLDEVLTQILLDYKIPVMLIAGNHDSPDRLGFANRLLQDRGLYIWSKISSITNSVVLNDQYGPVTFHAIPYVEPVLVREELAQEAVHSHDDAMAEIIRQLKLKMDSKSRHVLVTHAFVAGGEETESERPLSVGGSGIIHPSHFQDFDYVALGHLHKTQQVGNQRIRYSGSLMKYSFSEADHKKSVSIIDMDADGKISLEEISLTPRRDLRRIEGHLEEILTGSHHGINKEDYLMVTLKDEGALLDPMGKIKKIYPNALHIERPQFLSNRPLTNIQRDFKKINEVELFSSFYTQVTEREMNEQYRKILEKSIESFYQSLRGE